VDYIDYVTDIECFNSLIFVPDYLMYGDSKLNWILIDSSGNVVLEKENSLQPFSTNVVLPGCSYLFGNKIFYFNYFNDTVFSISSDLSINAAYLFPPGSYRWPKEKIEISPPNEFFDRISNLFQPVGMFETKHYIFMRYYYLHKAILLMIDKRTKTRFISVANLVTDESKYNIESGLYNDFDGGLPLWTMNYYHDDSLEYLTTLIQPYNLLNYISSDTFRQSVPKFPEKKIELEKLAHSLKETDNPVLVLVRLKK
jgi:hypothetical protein